MPSVVPYSVFLSPPVLCMLCQYGGKAYLAYLFAGDKNIPRSQISMYESFNAEVVHELIHSTIAEETELIRACTYFGLSECKYSRKSHHFHYNHHLSIMDTGRPCSEYAKYLCVDIDNAAFSLKCVAIAMCAFC